VAATDKIESGRWHWPTKERMVAVVADRLHVEVRSGELR